MKKNMVSWVSRTSDAGESVGEYITQQKKKKQNDSVMPERRERLHSDIGQSHSPP